MAVDVDTVIPSRDYLVWLRDGELRFGAPSRGEFIDLLYVSTSDIVSMMGVSSIAATSNGRICWYYAVARPGLFRIDWASPATIRQVWIPSRAVSISSMAAQGDRLFVMLQDLDKMTDCLCEYRNGEMVPVLIDNESPVDRLHYSVSLRMIGLDEGIVMHDFIGGRLWRWRPDHSLELIDASIDQEDVIGAGQPFQLWSAKGEVSGMLRGLGKNRRQEPFAMPSGLPLAGLVEHQLQVWGVDRAGGWFVLLDL